MYKNEDDIIYELRTRKGISPELRIELKKRRLMMDDDTPDEIIDWQNCGETKLTHKDFCKIHDDLWEQRRLKRKSLKNKYILHRAVKAVEEVVSG